MVRTQITLYDEDTEAFEAVREDLSGPCRDLSNAEVVRRLIGQHAAD